MRFEIVGKNVTVTQAMREQIEKEAFFFGKVSSD